MQHPLFARVLLVLALVLASTTTVAHALQTAATSSAPPARPEITREEIEAHVRWLADDERKGRVTGTKECEEAARYLARALEAAGARPAGDDDTFLQAVPLVRTQAKSLPKLALVTTDGARAELACGVDFRVDTRALAVRELRVTRIASLDRLPAQGDARTALFLDLRGADKRKALEACAPLGFGLLVVAGSETAGKPAVLERLRSPLQRVSQRPAPTLTLQGPWLARVRAGEVETLDLAADVAEEHVLTHNVVGRVDGVGTTERKELAAEALVLSAHYDHIAHAHDEAKPGEDVIYNGADDDASGTAIVLELAGALAHGPKPARTVIFLLATAEEIGLLGTWEYIDDAVVPLERTVANLNFEMLGRPDEKVGGRGRMWLTGYPLTNLGAEFTRRELAVFDDPRPEMNFYQRSDNYAFVMRGVIGQTFSTYNMHTDYHKASDEADRIDFEHMTTCARIAHEAVRLVADGTIDPTWTTKPAPPKSR